MVKINITNLYLSHILLPSTSLLSSRNATVCAGHKKKLFWNKFNNIFHCWLHSSRSMLCSQYLIHKKFKLYIKMLQYNKDCLNITTSFWGLRRRKAWNLISLVQAAGQYGSDIKWVDNNLLWLDRANGIITIGRISLNKIKYRIVV